MIAAELYHKSVLNPTLFEIYSSTIALHHAKKGYNYPTIRLPHTLARLAGLPTRIYQTIYDGALAFLVVVAPQANPSKQLENADTYAKSSVLTWRRSLVRIRPGPLFLLLLVD